MENLFLRTTASQLDLNEEMQALAKEGYRIFWTSIVKGSKNPEAKAKNLEAPGMNDSYYQNLASDKYKLLDARFEEVQGTSEGGLYSREDLVRYLGTVTKSSW